jgi:hypothetical protein
LRALLIDLDGVIRRWPASEADLETRHGLPVGAIRSVAFAPALLQPAITGRVSDESWRAGVAQQLAAAHPRGRAHEAVRAWSAVCGEVDQAASESVFVDDSLVNVHAAESLGMRSHLFEGVDGLWDFLRA